MSESTTFINTIFSLHRIKVQLQSYLAISCQAEATLPAACLRLTGLTGWWQASLVVGTVPYLLILGLSLLANRDSWSNPNHWRYIVLYPVVTIYLLLLAPIFRQILAEGVQAFLPLLPAKTDHTTYLREAYNLNRKREWLVFLVGMVIGWAITPIEVFANGWQIVYALIGEGLNIGLISWLAYSGAIQTKILTSLHNQTQGLNIPKQGHFSPLGRWGVTILASLVVGSLLGNFISPQPDILAPKNIIIYSILNLLVLFVFLRNSEATSLFTHFRILRAFSLFVFVALGGTLGYYYLEGWPPFDGLYMTVITMTTIGYGEIGDLHPRGRVFTIILSLISVGIAGYAISAVVAFIFEGDFQRALGRQKMNKQIANLSNHIILCGAGYIGEQIANEFIKTRTPFVIIEQNQEAVEHILRLADVPYLLGDATREETLMLCGINRAKGLIANLNDDKDNAFVILSARDLCPTLRIVTRLTDDENAEKLRKVGADEIVSPNVIGGLRIASAMIRPSVVSFLDEMIRETNQTLRVEETYLPEDSVLVGQSLAAAQIEQRTGLLVLARRSKEKAYQFNPPKETILRAQDTLIVMGTPDQLHLIQNLE